MRIITEFYRNRHVKFFKRCLDILPARYESLDSNRMTIAFFAISGLDMLDSLSMIEDRKSDIIDWIYSLQVLPGPSGEDHGRGGFQGSCLAGMKFRHNHDLTTDEETPNYVSGHLAMTYTALSVLIILGDDLSRVNRQSIVRSLKHTQLVDGSFQPVVDGAENDMRFLYCACCISYMIDDWSGIDINTAIDYIKKSQSYDGGFGQGPYIESHGGSTFCSIASLYLMDKLDSFVCPKSLESVRHWCLMRQQTGFQGRPNKPEDSCYSFWIGATLKMLNAYDMIESETLKLFTLSTQDHVIGGFAKWPGSTPDALHTYFSIGGLSFLNNISELRDIHPALNISQRAYKRLKSLHRLRRDS